MKIFWYYLKELGRFAKYKLIINLTLMVALGMLEGVGILMLIPLLGAAGIIPGLSPAGGAGRSLALLLSRIGASFTLPAVLILFTTIIVLKSWLECYQSNLNTHIQQSFHTFLSLRSFRSLAYANWPFLMQKKKSDITHALTAELTRISSGTHFLLQLIATMVLAAIQLGIAFVISPGLTLVVIMGGVALYGFMHRFVKESKIMGLALSNHTRELFFDVTEHLNGIKEVKSCGMEPLHVQHFARLRQTIESNFVRFNKIQSKTGMFYSVGAAVLISLFFYSGVEFIKIRSQDFLLVIIIFARLWPKLSSFQVAMQNMVMMLPAFQWVIDFEKQCTDNREITAGDRKCPGIGLKNGLEFRKVSFGYQRGSSAYAVKDISFTIPAGTTTALAGVSGSGKSTIADLITGMIVPEAGNVLLDGVSLTNVNLGSWRKSIGYVPQDAFLFHTSIRENLLLANPEASTPDMWKALRMAAVDEVVAALPDGLDAIVGDRGTRLSGGERQRIVLARALIREPSVLILDEATSSLDSENETKIYQAIEGLHGRLTILVIAHRIATLRNADQIIVLEKGSIVEKGSYSDLIQRENSRFCSLASL